MKHVWIVLFAFALLGTSQGPLFSTHAFDNAGDFPWVNETNAQVEDGVFATYVENAGGFTGDLASDTYGFSIPGNGTISGIQLEVKIKTLATSDGQFDLRPRPTAPFTIGIAVSPTTTLTWLSTGGSSQLYGGTPTPADINSSSFGADLENNTNNTTTTVDVDAFRITVFYTVPATKKNQVIGSLEHHAQTSYGGLITDKIIGENQ